MKANMVMGLQKKFHDGKLTMKEDSVKTRRHSLQKSMTMSKISQAWMEGRDWEEGEEASAGSRRPAGRPAGHLD